MFRIVLFVQCRNVGSRLSQLELFPQPQGIELEVCQDIANRQQFGIHKYGRTVADNPLALRQWLQHAYEECLDQAIYLKRAMREL